MDNSLSATAISQLSQLDDETLLQRILIASSTDSENELDTPFNHLDTHKPRSETESPNAAHTYFETTRQTLTHLLGDDIAFPSDISIASPKLLLLYRSAATRTLIADVLRIEEGTYTPELAHAFFARMAWIDESSVTTPQAKAQLDDLLYGITPLSNESDRLGTEEFSELGQVLIPVPQDLRMWMLQFKRGLRRQPLAEWLANCPAETLLQGLLSNEQAGNQDALTTLADVIERLLPTAGEYEDESLARSLSVHLASLSTRQLIEKTVLAIPAIPGPDTLKLELGAVLDESVCHLFFKNIALTALKSNDEPWLPLALENAQSAPGMQAFSFATWLAQQHPTLSADCCLRLGSLLFDVSAGQAPAVLAPLSNAHVLSPRLAEFKSWCSVSSIDEVFKLAGMELLCEIENGKHHLRLPAWQTWQAMMQSSNFAALFKPLLRKLGWYGAMDGEDASPRATQALAARAITEHFLGPWQQSARSVARDFRDKWVTEYSHVQLHQELTSSIIERNPNASPAALSMLKYLLVREIAPELLIAQVPDWLYYGRSLQSVALIHGARLLEALSPGAACQASYDKVVTLARDLSTSKDANVQRLWSQTLVLPALRYAMTHNAIDALAENDIHNASHQQIERALNFLKAEQQTFADDALELNAKAPDRKALAEAQLTLAGVDRLQWFLGVDDHRTWTHLESFGLTKANSYNSDYRIGATDEKGPGGLPISKPVFMSLLQLVMMGEINRTGESTVPQLYDRAFATFQDTWQQTHARLIKRLSKELPATYRAQLHGSTCEVSLLNFAGQESYQGLFIRCQRGDHRSDFDLHQASLEHYFEIFPSAGVIRSSNQQFQYDAPLDDHISGNIVDSEVKNDDNAAKILLARLSPLRPLDSDAYLHGTPSRSSLHPHQPIQGKLVPAAGRVYGAEESEDAFLQKLADAAAKHLYASPLATLRTANTHITAWEELDAEGQKILDFLARLVLPFYGCIKDLVDGEHSTGVITGCVIDAVTALVPVGQFISASARVTLLAGKLSIRAACEEMATALTELVGSLAQQSPLLFYRDLGRGSLWLSRKAWEGITASADWLKALARKHSLPGMTESGAYSVAHDVLNDWRESHPLDDLATVENTENSLVRNLGTEQNPGHRLLDPYTEQPYGPVLTEVERGASENTLLIALHTTNRIGSGVYPQRLLYEVSEEGNIHIAVPAECNVQIRAKGQDLYDITIDDHIYRLDTTRNDGCLSKLSTARIREQATLTEEDVICRSTRDLMEGGTCTAFTKLISVPAEQLPPSTETPTLGRDVSLAFENKEFHLDRRQLPATQQASERTLNVLVHEGKFCKWDHEVTPAKGRQAARVSEQKKLLKLSPEERSSLGLPAEPNYLPDVVGRMSTQRKFGLPDDLSNNQAKLINPFVPVVELDSVTAEVADKRILRGLSHSLNGQKVVYVEADTGQFYKAIQGQGELKFSQVTEPEEINEYLRLSEQFRFVAGRSHSLKDRENIAKLLFRVAVEKNNHGIEAWLAQTPANRNYSAYVEWCEVNNKENTLLHLAENILSAEDAQVNFIEETTSIIPDWKRLDERSEISQLHTIGILNHLLPAQGKEVLLPALSRSNIMNADTVELIGKQMNDGNLAYAMISTQTGERYVYYALSGGKRTKGVRLRIDMPDINSRVKDNVTYIDARALMKNRSPDPDFTSLPVVRHADELIVTPFDRYLDSERLIATVVKENFVGKPLEYIKVFTRLDTCRSCGAVVLPQLKLDFPDTEFSVTYLKDYPGTGRIQPGI